MSSIFDGIENAKATRDGNWVRNGAYVLQLNSVRQTKKFNGEVFVAIESKVAEVLDNDEGRGHKVGEDVVHLLKVTQESFLGNFKSFAAAVLGCKAEDITKAVSDRITSDEQPLAGSLVKATARTITTRKNQPFTKIMYSNVNAPAAPAA